MGTHVIAVVGATATGKSGLATELARALGGEVVNADSMQLYRGMDIGTAKEPEAARQGVPHHLLDIWPVTQTANVADYAKLARAAIDEIIARDRVPVLVGGSGLYVRAALDDLDFPGTDPGIRARLEEELGRVGAAALHARLARLDPVAAAAILPGNGRRIVRALEVIEISGRPFTATMPAYLRTAPPSRSASPCPGPNSTSGSRPASTGCGRRAWKPRCASLAAQGLRDGKTASRALGYQQLLRYLDGEWTLEEARLETIKATRRFARRQESWFRRDPRVRWLDASQPAAPCRATARQVLQLPLHLVAEPVGTLGVVGAEHPGQPHHGPFGVQILLEPRAQERGQGGPEQRRAQVVQLRQAERVRGVQELPVRRQLERLGQQRWGPAPRLCVASPAST